ncbi:MAG: hypothetical protein IT372_32575 [Polyangiaceae bacterium]|nr:hypothetical protein [Polyangiaceae bacterium]
MRNKNAILPILSTLILAACGGATPAPTDPAAAAADPAGAAAAADPAAAAGAAATPAGPLKAPGEAAVGDKTTCPVSGEEFVVEASSPKVEFEGKT